MTALAFDRISKRFGMIDALTEVSFAVQAGSVTGLLGLNGAGKTTAIRVCFGLLNPTSGSVRVLDGAANSRPEPGVLGGLVSRPALHPHLTVLETVAIYGALSARGDSITRMSDRLLKEFGVEGVARRRVGALSSGMRQRVGVAVAFCGRPSVLVLDEPTESLDPEGVAMVREAILRRKAEGVAILLSSHLLPEIEALADAVVIIHEGKVVAEGTQDQLRQRPHLQVGFDSPEAARRAKEALNGQMIGAESDDSDQRLLRVHSEDGAAVVGLLATAGLYPSEVRHVRQSLEQVFLRAARGHR
ncbi:MAG: ABC transporter ATP-binding protein [Chloroflexi bacterium]|nr:ABC transporter ATP-binding protein [Chloroflexota bacterium]